MVSQQDWVDTQCGGRAWSLAAPCTPAEKEMDRESTLPGCVYLRRGCVALAGQVGISARGAGLPGTERRRQALGTSARGAHFRVPTPTHSRDPGAFSAWESPTVFPVGSLNYLFWPNPVPMNFSSCDQQFITKTNRQNLSHLKNNPAVKRIDSPNAPDGCQVLYFVWFTKVLFVQ